SSDIEQGGPRRPGRGQCRREARSAELSLDRGLVEHGPDVPNFPVAKFIEDVLGEAHPAAVHRKTEEPAFRGHVEAEPAGDQRRIDREDLSGEAEVGDLLEVVFKHGAIAAQAQWPPIVPDIVADEGAEFLPSLPVQAGDVAAIDARKIRRRHGVSLWKFATKTALHLWPNPLWAMNVARIAGPQRAAGGS